MYGLFGKTPWDKGGCLLVIHPFKSFIRLKRCLSGCKKVVIISLVTSAAGKYWRLPSSAYFWEKYHLELGTRQYCRDNVTMLSDHKVVSYCNITIFVVATPSRPKYILNLFWSPRLYNIVALLLSRSYIIAACPALKMSNALIFLVGLTSYMVDR